jgi:hypothetical protein
LSVAKTVKVYEGRLCLELLKLWQQDGDTASVVDFLYRKLDMLPLSDISRRIQVMRREHMNDHLVKRLVHGRMVMLNCSMNLFHALDSIFALPEEELQHIVSQVCERYGHHPRQIAQQLQEMDSPLFAFVPHPMLAQRNMLVMNKLGVGILSQLEDPPSLRSQPLGSSDTLLPPAALWVVQPYLDMTSPHHNNINRETLG